MLTAEEVQYMQDTQVSEAMPDLIDWYGRIRQNDGAGGWTDTYRDEPEHTLSGRVAVDPPSIPEALAGLFQDATPVRITLDLSRHPDEGDLLVCGSDRYVIVSISSANAAWATAQVVWAKAA